MGGSCDFFGGMVDLAPDQDVIQAFLKLYPVAEQKWHELLMVPFLLSFFTDPVARIGENS